ncbi:MAG: NUDIX domain-containing protein [Bacteroidota bacterium]
MPKISAGLLMYRIQNDELEVFLIHHGGPYNKRRQEGHWGIPKGLVDPGDEDLLSTAIREFEEETGISTHSPYLELGQVQYRSSRKIIHAWAFEGNWNPEEGLTSNTFEMEWPPRSGQLQAFPEIDEGRWMDLETAKVFIHPTQWPLVERLSEKVEIPH